MTTRRTRRLVAAGVAVAVSAATAAVVAVLIDRPAPDVRSPIAAAFQGHRELREPARAVLVSPSGRALLVLSDDGVGLAGSGKVRALLRQRSNVVDAAWFPSENAVLVAEGPLPTGQLGVVELDGEVRGSIPLSPSFAVGAGYGMDIAPSGRRAVAAAEVRDPIGGARHLYLVRVDLETGATTELTRPDGDDEVRPFHLDDGQVVFTATGTRSAAMVIDLTTGDIRRISGEGENAAVVGVVGDQPAYVVARTVWIGVDPTTRTRLGRFEDPVAAVHPAGHGVITRSRAGIFRWHELS